MGGWEKGGVGGRRVGWVGEGWGGWEKGGVGGEPKAG